MDNDTTALYSVNGEDTCTLADTRTANPDDPYVVEQAAALRCGEVWDGYHCQIERVR